MNLLDLALNHWGFFSFLLAALAGCGVWYLARHFVTWKAWDLRKEKIDSLLESHEKRLALHEAQLAANADVGEELKGTLASLLRREDMLPLDVGMAEIRGDIKALRASLDGLENSMSAIKHQTNMIIQHHVENS